MFFLQIRLLLSIYINIFFQILDGDGIAAPGEIIRNHDIYVNKWSPKRIPDQPGNLRDKYASILAVSWKFSVLIDDLILHYLKLYSDYKPTPAVYKCPDGEINVIDRVMLCSDINNKMCIKFLMRHTRRPEVSLRCI